MTPARPPAIRVGDAERQVVVARLQAALDEGRLDLHEFDERAALAYAAKTEADLEPLTADLPQQHSAAATPGAPMPAAAGARGVKRSSRLSGGEASWLRLALLLTGIWLISSVAQHEPTFYWPIFPLGVWGLVLIGNRITGRPH